MSGGELQRLVELGLLEGRDEVAVGLLERHPFDAATSYAMELLRVQFDAAEPLEVVVKDFGSTRLPKDDVDVRAERELTVYRDLLEGTAVGTARLYGVARQPVRLLLEHVEGTTLKFHDREAWIEAASWLGVFQAQMAKRLEQIVDCPVLIRHDASFFLDRAHAAHAAMASLGPETARRLRALLDGYERLVEVMVDQPRTLVHGSFRPQNIIVSPAGETEVRICPVDWELAGLGSPLYDLAFLAEGFHGDALDRLLSAYLQGADHHESVAVSDVGFAVDCFRLHKVLKSLADSVMLAFRPATVDKLLQMGRELRDRLG